MYDDILVPVDDRDPSTVALGYALEVAAVHGATVDLLYVADTNKPSQVQYQGAVVDVLEREGERVLESARERAKASGVPVRDEIVQGDPRAEIVALAEGADLVVMGTHGRSGLDGYLLGSVTEHVVRKTETPVLAVREKGTRTYPPEAILVPFDGSPHARDALSLATAAAADAGATLHLLAVVDEPTFGDVGSSTGDDAARELLETAATEIDDVPVETYVETGAVPETIRTVATDVGADLVVMGTHGRQGVNERLLGSTTDRVLRSAPVPVLTTGSEADD
ncbi:universal stress protein [Halovivax limisalsi]|uniref:universal stress protein n=1 Tax=Halovivax limisalsi TaxID=1453760 RepID=UPI001FFDC400|nr:universal stress protein [Halovivax limisalsi]